MFFIEFLTCLYVVFCIGFIICSNVICIVFYVFHCFGFGFDGLLCIVLFLLVFCYFHVFHVVNFIICS